MNPWMLEWAIAAVSIAAWFGLYGLVLLWSRPTRVEPGPATQDLGPESPALVSILANGWDIGEEGIEATLVDLAARRIIEFRQPDDDPFHTTIHIVQRKPTGLNRYEQRVFDRVAGLEVNGLVPLTALPFRDERQAKSWWKLLRAEIISEARTRGLSMRRFSPVQLVVLGIGAAVATAGVDIAMVHWALRQPPSTDSDDDPMGLVIGATIFVLAGLLGVAWANVGERDTPAGREAAARWLGVKEWLRAHEAFSDLPPAAVATWDRYISYGVAVGASRVVAQVIDMGMGNRRRVWSSFGGNWRRVRVSYPRLWARYGLTAPPLVFRGLLAFGVGYVLARYWRPVVNSVSTEITEVPRVGLVETVGTLVGVALLAYGGYMVVRTFVDLFTPRTITGQVLWMQVWRSTSGGENRPSVPWLYYLAVDDGRTDRTRAWGLPASLVHHCSTGDTITLKVRPWSRRVGEVTVVEQGGAGFRTDTSAADRQHESLVASISGVPQQRLLSPPSVASGRLLNEDEVGLAIGIPVAAGGLPLPGPLSTTTFRTADGKRVVLLLQVGQGPLIAAAWRQNSKGQQLQGIGDGAWHDGDRAVVMVGGTFVVLTLVGKGKGRGSQLPELLRAVAARIATPAP